MAGKTLSRSTPGLPDTEKITVNLGFVDLGQIDLLVKEGFYSNRTDFIRTAIRNQLTAHADVLRQTVARRTLVLGGRSRQKRRPRRSRSGRPSGSSSSRYSGSASKRNGPAGAST